MKSALPMLPHSDMEIPPAEGGPDGSLPPVLELREICKAHGRGAHRQVLFHKLDLCVAEHEWLVVLAADGRGKTSLISLMAGLQLADEGAVLFRGLPVLCTAAAHGALLRGAALRPWLSVHDNLVAAIGHTHRGLPMAQQHELATHYVRRLGLHELRHQKPRKLDAAQLQRALLARTLALEPELLLLDEPLRGLDAWTRAALCDALAPLPELRQRSCVWITDDVDEALQLADRIVVLQAGSDGDSRLGSAVRVDLPRPRRRLALQRDADYIALRKTLIEALQEPVPTSIATGSTGPHLPSPDDPAPAAANEEHGTARRSPRPERYLEFSAVGGHDGSARTRFSLKVEQGECVALLGPPDGRASALLAMAAGLQAIAHGAIVFDGRQIDAPAADRHRLTAAPSLQPWRSVSDNLMQDVRAHFPQLDAAARRAVVLHYLARVGLQAEQRRAGSLPPRAQHSLALARAFALSPKLLLLDEPFAALAQADRWVLQAQLLALWSRTRPTLLLATHDIDEAILVADRIVVLGNENMPFEVRLPRPRSRLGMLEQAAYYTLRAQLLRTLAAR